MIRIKVVLPQPEGPMKETNSPALICRLISDRAKTGVSAVWKVNPRLRISMMVSAPATNCSLVLPADWIAAGCPCSPIVSLVSACLPSEVAAGLVIVAAPLPLLPSEGIGPLDHGSQQDIDPGGTIALGGVLDLVMAGPIP